MPAAHLLILSSVPNANFVFFVSLMSLIIVLLSMLFIWQYRRGKRLSGYLTSVGSVQRHTVEHEMVLKSMRLSAWRIDARTREIIYESDYRDSVDSYTPRPGEKIDDFVKHLHPKDSERYFKAMDDICAGRIDEYTQQYQVRVGNTDKYYWAESYATIAERDDSGHPLTIVGASMRIDKRKNMEQALIKARNEAEENDRLKSAFLAHVSHEIRTPLNAIIGFSEVLPMTESDEERQGLIALIHENNTKMLDIFDNIVNMSKLEAADVGYKRSEFSLTELLREAGEKQSVKIIKKGLTLNYNMPQNDLLMYTDRQIVMIIINHYADNAVKYTNEGTVTLGYTVNSDGGPRLFVADTGIGISRDESEHIFERFVKLNDFTQGMGLGLSISRSLAYHLGGKVGVESQEGKGSIFWLDLPQSEVK